MALLCRHSDSGRLLGHLDVPGVAFMRANGTEEAPQFANPWAYRNLPYVGYRPAYIMHHGHWMYMTHLRRFAATPGMTRTELQVWSVAAVRAVAWAGQRR